MDNNTIGYKWSPIEDYAADETDKMKSDELNALAKVWHEQRKDLESSGLMVDFLQRLERNWAIETGVIEKLYTLDRGVTQILIEKGIAANYIDHNATNKDPKFVASIINDQYDVIEGLFSFVKQDRQLSTSYIKELHAAFCRNQRTTEAVDPCGYIRDVELRKGDYKVVPNSPCRPDGSLHEYCPPEQVASEMDNLIRLHNKHIKDHISPEVEAAWIHHRFTQIHPFQDGNGRVARAIASLIFMKAGWFPLTITRDDRVLYIQALEAADQGNLSPLVSLFTKIQRNTFTSALGIAGHVKDTRQIPSIISGIKDKLIEKQQQLKTEREKAKIIAKELILVTEQEMQKLSSVLRTEIGTLLSDFSPYNQIANDGDSNDYFFKNQIVEMAKNHNYYANTSVYRAWARFIIPGATQCEILVSAHGIGYEYRGMIAFAACYFSRSESSDAHKEIGNFTILGKELFQVNYKDHEDRVKRRYSVWINDVLAEGLSCWQQEIGI